MHTLARRIKAVRDATGKNQRDFAAELQISQSAVSRYERGDDDPGDEILEAMLALSIRQGDERLPWTTIGELRYGIATSTTVETTVHIFDLDTLAEFGRRFSSVGNAEFIRRSRGPIDLSLGGRNLVAFPVKDDSMARFASEGSLVIIDLDDTDLDDGEIGVFLLKPFGGPKQALFRMLRTTGAVRLEPSNPSASADAIFLDEDPVALGRALTVVSDLPKSAV